MKKTNVVYFFNRDCNLTQTSGFIKGHFSRKQNTEHMTNYQKRKKKLGGYGARGLLSKVIWLGNHSIKTGNQ